MKILTILSAILCLTSLQTGCEGFDPIGITESAVSIGQTIWSLKNLLFDPEKTIDQTLAYLKTMDGQMQYDLTQIMKALKDLPAIIELTLKKQTLEGHFANIARVFEEAVIIRKRVNGGKIEFNNTFYQNFRQNNEGSIDISISEIQRILTDQKTVSFLSSSFNDALKKFQTVCQTGMTHMQLLNTLLGSLKMATAQYYMIKSSMYTFIELKGEENYTQVKINLLEDVHRKYKQAIDNFKNTMKTASRELYRCDPSEDKKNSSYVELKAFTKYYANENTHTGSDLFCTTNKCSSITNVGKCSNDKLCEVTRGCPGKLFGCQTESYTGGTYMKVCVNTNKSAYNRYKSIVDYKFSEKFSCQDGTIMKLDSVVSTYQSTGYSTSCDYCSCICEEDKIFISTQFAGGPFNNRVITGVKFVLGDDKTLYIQVKQGILRANGRVDRVEWSPIRKEEVIRHPITWNDLNRIVPLTKIERPGYRALVDLRFDYSSIDGLRLLGYFKEFDFITGESLDYYSYPYGSKPGTEEFKLNNADNPTKSNRPNNPVSKDNQFVKFSISSIEKDGGQSFIPFIDTQEVVSNPPTPMSGIQLFIRGQEGSGGFLAMKLLTYDVVPHINSELELTTSEIQSL